MFKKILKTIILIFVMCIMPINNVAHAGGILSTTKGSTKGGGGSSGGGGFSGSF